MYFATCYNHNAGDTFYAFGNTQKQTLEMLEKAYKDFYDMTNRDVKEDGYKTVLDYILHEKEVELLNVKTNEPVAYIHGYDITFYKDVNNKLNRVSNDSRVEYIPTDD